MANFPAGLIYIWTGTNANIPSGWERVTALDGLYPKGAADSTDPNDTGGSATHTHSADATHGHAQVAHVHSITLSATADTTQMSGTGTGLAARTHTHSSPFDTTGMSAGDVLSTVASTYAALSNDPPYYTVIFITPSANTGIFPDNAVYLYEDDDAESLTGHYFCDGDNSTPNLVGKYLKGAATDGDAGDTGGSVTNVHTLTHTHTVSSHTHTRTTPAPGATLDGEDGNLDVASSSHTHAITTSATTATLTGTVELTTGETVEPAYTKLLAVQNQNVNGARKGMIGMWLGTLANIPGNYSLLNGTSTTDMRGKHLKLTVTYSEVADTGGSNTHAHASQTHTHTGAAHTHTVGNLSHTGAWNDTTTDTADVTPENFVHTVSVANATSTYANGSTSADSQNNEPEYRTVAFIKLMSLSGGAFLLNMI